MRGRTSPGILLFREGGDNCTGGVDTMTSRGAGGAAGTPDPCALYVIQSGVLHLVHHVLLHFVCNKVLVLTLWHLHTPNP